MGLEFFWLPFLASLAVILGFRRLDKSNGKLPQLKRYAQKLALEIQLSSQDKLQEVKDAGLGLDILLKQSKKAQEDIQLRANETKHLLEQIKKDQTELAEIKSQMLDVSSLGNQIKRESLGLEESVQILQSHKQDIQSISNDLDRIHDESQTIVQLFQNKLQNRSDEILDSLAEKLVELESKVDSRTLKLDEHIEQIAIQSRDKLLQHADLMFRESSGKLDQARKEFDHLMDSMRVTREETDLKLTQFEDTAALISEKVSRFDERFEDRSARIQSKIEDRTNSLEKRIQDRFDSIFEQISSQKENLLKGMLDETESLKREMEDLSLQTLSKRDEIINETRRQADQINQTILSFQEKYLEAENKLLRQADSRKQDLIREMETFGEEFQRISGDLKEESLELKKSALQELRSFEKDLDQAKARQEDSLRASLTALKFELQEKLHSTYEDKEKESKEAILHVQSKIQSLNDKLLEHETSVDDYVADLKQALRETASEILEAVENKAKNADSYFEEKIQEAERQISVFVAKWEEELYTMRETQFDSVQGIENRIKQIHIEGQELLGAFEKECSEAKVALSSTANEEARRISESLHQGIRFAKEEVERSLKELESLGEAFFQKQTDKIGRLNETIDSKISSQLTKLLDKGNLQLEELENKISNHLSNVKRNLEDSIKRSKEESKKQIDSYQEDYKKTFMQMTQDNHEVLSESRARFEALRDEIQMELNSAKDLKETSFVQISSEAKRIENDLIGIKNKLNDLEKHKDLFDSVKEVAIRGTETVLQIQNALDTLENKKPDIEAFIAYTDRYQNLQTELEESLGLWENKHNELSLSDSKIESLLDELGTVAKDLEGFRRELPLLGELEERIKFISTKQDKLETYLSTLSESQDQISKMAESIELQKQNTREIQARMDVLDQEIEIVEAREKELAETIRIAEKRSEFLAHRSSQIESVERKFDKIEELMADLSERHRQILALQKKMEDLKNSSEDSKEELESLLSESEEMFGKLSQFLDVVQGAIHTDPSPAKAQTHLAERKRATILNLFENYKWSSEAISEKLNIEKSLVDTILGARKK